MGRARTRSCASACARKTCARSCVACRCPRCSCVAWKPTCAWCRRRSICSAQAWTCICWWTPSRPSAAWIVPWPCDACCVPVACPPPSRWRCSRCSAKRLATPSKPSASSFAKDVRPARRNSLACEEKRPTRRSSRVLALLRRRRRRRRRRGRRGMAARWRRLGHVTRPKTHTMHVEATRTARVRTRYDKEGAGADGEPNDWQVSKEKRAECCQVLSKCQTHLVIECYGRCYPSPTRTNILFFFPAASKSRRPSNKSESEMLAPSSTTLTLLRRIPPPLIMRLAAEREGCKPALTNTSVNCFPTNWAFSNTTQGTPSAMDSNALAFNWVSEPGRKLSVASSACASPASP
mmetsp:Transcript_9880/g.60206  ORF Transcript_9880/g.60206 Transcript_9880/m.60206 type:complete len:349 (+) Transcript_9880:316-1362(+)